MAQLANPHLASTEILYALVKVPAAPLSTQLSASGLENSAGQSTALRHCAHVGEAPGS